jgi:hypothetical protein
LSHPANRPDHPDCPDRPDNKTAKQMTVANNIPNDGEANDLSNDGAAK